MIIAHFFLRTVKKTTYLMCETTCSSRSESPWKEPVRMFKVPRDGDLSEWIARSREKLLVAHPGYEPGDVAVPGSDREERCFDITLKKAPNFVNKLIRKIL